MDKRLTVNEVAERLGCTTAHVRLLLKEGKLRGEKFGRDWMISSLDFTAFEKSYAPTTGRPRSEAKAGTRRGKQ